MCDPRGDAIRPLRTIWRHAKKPHHCIACDEQIRPGDPYHVSTWVEDGHWETIKHCPRCWVMLCVLWARTRGPVDLGLDCGETWDDVFGDVPDDVAALAFWLPGDRPSKIDRHLLRTGHRPTPRPAQPSKEHR